MLTHQATGESVETAAHPCPTTPNYKAVVAHWCVKMVSVCIYVILGLGSFQQVPSMLGLLVQDSIGATASASLCRIAANSPKQSPLAMLK